MLTDTQNYMVSQISRSGTYNMTDSHSHNSYEIYYMLSGERYYFIKDRSYHVRAGDLVLIEPMALHKTTEAFTVSHERILINFREAYIDSLAHEIGLAYRDLFGGYPVLRLDMKDRLYVESVFGQLLEEQNGERADSTAMSKLLLGELLLWLSRHRSRLAGEESERQEHPTTLHRKVSDIVQYLNHTYREELNLKSVAEAFHISRFYLCHIFKEATGFTLMEYVHRMRVREAQRLLQDTRLPMPIIAEQVGFESATHFGRVFKSVCGLSPLKYRKSVAAASSRKRGY